MRTWFTSDTHYGHANIIKYCNRPFNNADEMNEKLIEYYNKLVQPGDVVYHLGDVGFMQVDRLLKIINRLNGQKILIIGNHDKVIRGARGAFLKVFGSIHDYLEVTVEGQKMVLCHYPLLTWNGSGRGSIMLHGHAHGNSNYGHLKTAKIMDVGVDCTNYAPISELTVLRLMGERQAEDFGRNREL